MADTVDVKVVRNSDNFYQVRMTNYSDGTGESAVKKIDVSTLTGPNGAETDYLSLLEAAWDVKDGSVQLFWDAATDDEMIQCQGSGYRDYRSAGGLVDPKSTTHVGDVLLTTKDFVAGSAYQIDLVFRKKT